MFSKENFFLNFWNERVDYMEFIIDEFLYVLIIYVFIVLKNKKVC